MRLGAGRALELRGSLYFLQESREHVGLAPALQPLRGRVQGHALRDHGATLRLRHTQNTILTLILKQ